LNDNIRDFSVMSLDNIILKRAVYNTRMNITEWNSHLVGLYIPLDVFINVKLMVIIGHLHLFNINNKQH
jgi:hypothetical protein